MWAFLCLHPRSGWLCQTVTLLWDPVTRALHLLQPRPDAISEEDSGEYTFTHTHISSEMGDLESLLSFVSLSFCQDKFLNYTWRWLRWRRRDHILQELSLQVGMEPEREHEKELGEVSLQEAKRKGIRRRKDRTPVPIPQPSDSAQTDLRPQFFLLILFLCFLGCSSRTEQTKVLN